MQMKDYIQHSFRNSKKRHILITGGKGSGKTTLFKMLLPCFLKTKHGLTSYLEDNERVILKDDESGLTQTVGKRMDGWMKCIHEGFSGFGCTQIEKLIHSEQDWCSIDEIGFLENEVESYKNKIRQLFDTKHILCCVRKQDLPFLNEIKKREDVFLWDMDYTKVGCILMASGLSTRFGSNKLLVNFHEKTLFEHALCASDSFPFMKRKVYTRTFEIKDICDEKEIDVCFHSLVNRNDAIALAMNDMEEMNACIFIPCDQPLLSYRSVEKIVEKAMASDKNMIRLASEEKVGSPILFKRKYFESLKTLPEKKGGSYIVRQHLNDVDYVYVENAYELFDVDTYEDFEGLQKFVSEC